LYGIRSGIATSYRVGGSPIESQHPWEIAETSAIGRALAAMGYGLLPGSGLASAEDMERALSREDEPKPRRSKAAASAEDMSKAMDEPKPVDFDGLRRYIVDLGWKGEQQSDFIDLAKESKWDKAEVKARLTAYDEMATKDYVAFASKLDTDLKVARGEA
jgi:hypothetical protein